MSTHYRYDVYEALLAQHPSLYGVVATAPGTTGLVGFASAFIDRVTVGHATYPRAHLENLKVRHDVRRMGLGARLAKWRIDEAHRRFRGAGVISTGIGSGNTASLATASKWSTQVLGPVRLVIARTLSKPPRGTGLVVRPVADDEIDRVVEALNAFYGGYDLYPPQTPTALREALAPTSLGVVLRQCRVAVANDGTMLAGAVVTERFKLMTDHVDRLPRVMALASRIVPLFPPDRVIRMIELSLAWHGPGQEEAGRALWDAIRFEWRDRATHVTGIADPRGSLTSMFRIGRTIVPQLELMVPVQTPVPLDENRPVYVWR
jgi:GNAT superfamily N-acetyltransferase